MIPEDTYEGFAERYHLFYDAFDEHGPLRAGFFRKVFKDNNVRSVLDCACGIGRDLVLFHSLGVEVSGSDISDAMLEEARKNLTERGLGIPLRKADYRELPAHHDMRFDAVVCLAGSLLEMPDEKEALRALRSMHGVLGESGVLILSQGTADKQWCERPRFILAANRPDFSRVFVIDYLDKGARYNILDIFHSGEREEFRVWSKQYDQILLRDDYSRLLPRAGFSDVHFYGSYGFDRYDKETSDILIIMARR